MYKDSYNKMKNVTKGLEDSLLEIDESEMQKAYEEFYDDVFSEWSRFGKIVQFKCCNNLQSHIRGNVFIQYENVEAAIMAKVNLDGRFYGGYPLNVNFSLIKDWKQAICAYNGPEMTSCPKYSECNFLHTYRNPRNEFPIERRPAERERRPPRRFDSFKRKSRSPRREPFVKKRSRSRSKDRPREHGHRKDSRERKSYKRRDRSRSRSRSHDRKHDKKKSYKKRSRSRDRNRSSS